MLVVVPDSFAICVGGLQDDDVHRLMVTKSYSFSVSKEEKDRLISDAVVELMSH